MSKGLLVGFVLQGQRPLASSREHPVFAEVVGLKGQYQQAERGMEASGLGFLPVGNPSRRGTMARAETGASGGFVVPYSVEGHRIHGQHAGRAGLKFRVGRGNRRAGTELVTNYVVVALALPVVANYEELMYAIVGRWQQFCVPAALGAGEAGLDKAMQKPSLGLIRTAWGTISTAWSRIETIANPDERFVMMSIIRVGYA